MSRPLPYMRQRRLRQRPLLADHVLVGLGAAAASSLALIVYGLLSGAAR